MPNENFSQQQLLQTISTQTSRRNFNVNQARRPLSGAINSLSYASRALADPGSELYSTDVQELTELSRTLSNQHSHAILAADYDVANAIDINIAPVSMAPAEPAPGHPTPNELIQSHVQQMTLATTREEVVDIDALREDDNETEISGGQRTGSSPNSNSATSMTLQQRYAEALQSILDRYHNYTLAKSEGRLGTCPDALKQLPRIKAQKDQEVEKREKLNLGVKLFADACPLCLDEFKEGDEYTTLPCGHVFHTGFLETVGNENCGLEQQQDQVEQAESGKKRKAGSVELVSGVVSSITNGEGIPQGKCRGILFWLENHQTCPQCRKSLPAKYPKPSKSEQIIVPLLHRQYNVINKKARVIQLQEQQIAYLQRQLQLLQQERVSEKEKYTLGSCFKQQPRYCPAHNRQWTAVPQPHQQQPLQTQADSSFAFVEQFCLPRPTWQDTTLHRDIRMEVLTRVTDIVLNDVNIKMSMQLDEQEKHKRLKSLAAKLELIMFCCAKDLKSYSDVRTLKDRTVRTIKVMAERAKFRRDIDEHEAHFRYLPQQNLNFFTNAGSGITTFNVGAPFNPHFPVSMSLNVTVNNNSNRRPVNFN